MVVVEPPPPHKFHNFKTHVFVKESGYALSLEDHSKVYISVLFSFSLVYIHYWAIETRTFLIKARETETYCSML